MKITKCFPLDSKESCLYKFYSAANFDTPKYEHHNQTDTNSFVICIPVYYDHCHSSFIERVKDKIS